MAALKGHINRFFSLVLFPFLAVFFLWSPLSQTQQLASANGLSATSADQISYATFHSNEEAATFLINELPASEDDNADHLSDFFQLSFIQKVDQEVPALSLTKLVCIQEAPKFASESTQAFSVDANYYFKRRFLYQAECSCLSFNHPNAHQKRSFSPFISGVAINAP
jgi:hypothetical protein